MPTRADEPCKQFDRKVLKLIGFIEQALERGTFDKAVSKAKLERQRQLAAMRGLAGGTALANAGTQAAIANNNLDFRTASGRRIQLKNPNKPLPVPQERRRIVRANRNYKALPAPPLPPRDVPSAAIIGAPTEDRVAALDAQLSQVIDTASSSGGLQFGGNSQFANFIINEAGEEEEGVLGAHILDPQVTSLRPDPNEQIFSSVSPVIASQPLVGSTAPRLPPRLGKDDASALVARIAERRAQQGRPPLGSRRSYTTDDLDVTIRDAAPILDNPFKANLGGESRKRGFGDEEGSNKRGRTFGDIEPNRRVFRVPNRAPIVAATRPSDNGPFAEYISNPNTPLFKKVRLLASDPQDPDANFPFTYKQVAGFTQQDVDVAQSVLKKFGPAHNSFRSLIAGPDSAAKENVLKYERRKPGEEGFTLWLIKAARRSQQEAGHLTYAERLLLQNLGWKG